MARKKSRKPNKTYTLPSKSGLKDDTIRVLSFDPGSRNFGISCVATKNGKVRVMANSIVTNPIFDLTRFEVQKKTFLAEIGQWVELYKPQALIAERFQTRGIGGPLIEIVTTMNALVSAHFGLNTLLIVASQWKLAYQRRFDFALDDLYRQVLVPPHQLDASLIGVYGLEKGLRTQLDFEPADVGVQVENTSRLPLLQRRM
ncbi:RuvC_resolvase like protein [Ralstonia phage phiRSL1]|uniref:RuvC_resolvase like protein n=1 Tax=Ralstonia phage phiRSL1 TaxID=1980924 RepID=B2ZYB4_9CAUD|nr:Holliday junction resolvase [Ralstonia phage phiRSL1]BAG41664.1 RuvC_resolvase like protein [Ralstonia phage phiRSL1]